MIYVVQCPVSIVPHVGTLGMISCEYIFVITKSTEIPNNLFFFYIDAYAQGVIKENTARIYNSVNYINVQEMQYVRI